LSFSFTSYSNGALGVGEIVTVGVGVSVGSRDGVGDITGVGGNLLVGVGLRPINGIEKPPPEIHKIIIVRPIITRSRARTLIMTGKSCCLFLKESITF